MKRLNLVLMVAVLTVAAACSKEKKITKSLWKGEGTWNVTSSSFAYYSMGTYNTTTGKYEDSLTVASGNWNGSTFVFEKPDDGINGAGTLSNSDTTINFSYFVTEDVDFNTGKPNGNFKLVLENDPPSGGTSEQEFYHIVSNTKTNMSLENNNNTGWSTSPYTIVHSYIKIDMTKQ